ncbi:MAG: tetratricopeptide repeat protein [Nitrosomonadales bacterium]|nr:tetratricopeptide repeat protein [Nitrosomonadales bacterium]
MNLPNRSNKCAALFAGALLLCFGLTASADELQDINKLLKQGKTEQALERTNNYLTSKPKDAQGRFLKGLILTEQGKTADAIRVFTELTEDYPELPEPYNNLAVLYASQGQYDKARIALEMAIRTHPSYATAHENLGDIYAKLASQAYDRALQLDRGNTSTQTKLSLIKDLFSNSSTKSSKPAKTAAHAEAATVAAKSLPAELAEPAAATEKIAVSEPAATAAPAVAESRSAADSTAAILQTVHDWAAAWSAKNVKGYLAFYADDFKILDGASRADWEAQRTDRIRKPGSIQVDIGNPKVKLMDANHASVSFKQSYRASHLKNHSNKTLVLVKSGSNWLIQEERTGK